MPVPGCRRLCQIRDRVDRRRPPAIEERATAADQTQGVCHPGGWVVDRAPRPPTSHLF
jgi:hypothetical protein